MDRSTSFGHLTAHLKNEQLVKHCMAVEVAMRAMARRFGHDEEAWGITGLVHDIDYEEEPDPKLHSLKGAEILASFGYSDDMVAAVRAHNPAHGLPRDTLLAKALYAVDELTGFIAAVALVRPSKKIADVEVSSVTKKFKDKAFARQVDREAMRCGADELGLTIQEHVGIVLDAMKAASAELAL